MVDDGKDYVKTPGTSKIPVLQVEEWDEFHSSLADESRSAVYHIPYLKKIYEGITRKEYQYTEKVWVVLTPKLDILRITQERTWDNLSDKSHVKIEKLEWGMPKDESSYAEYEVIYDSEEEEVSD